VKQINAQLGTAAGATLHADVAAATVDLAAVQTLIGTADGTDLAEDLVEIYDEAVALP
jgi:hypothetical protein